MEPLISLFLTSVMSTLGFKAREGPNCLHAMSPACDTILRFTSGATPAEGRPFRSAYLCTSHIDTFLLRYTCGLIWNVCMVKWRWSWFIMAPDLLCYLHSTKVSAQQPSIRRQIFEDVATRPQRKLTSIKRHEIFKTLSCVHQPWAINLLDRRLLPHSTHRRLWYKFKHEEIAHLNFLSRTLNSSLLPFSSR